MHKAGFTFAVARHSHRSRNRRSKQAAPVLAPVEAVAKRGGYGLESYSNIKGMYLDYFRYMPFRYATN